MNHLDIRNKDFFSLNDSFFFYICADRIIEVMCCNRELKIIVFDDVIRFLIS